MRRLLLLGALSLGAFASPARGMTREARPGEAAAALTTAAPGDTVVLRAGVHSGPLHVEKAIVLRGEPGAVVDGGGHGSVLHITAAGARVEDLEVRRSGSRVLTIDGGVHVTNAAGVTLHGVTLRDVLYGIYAERSSGLRVEHCDLAGRVRPLDENEQGNGIHLWYCDAPQIEQNQVTRFTDAVYLSFVDHAVVLGNRLQANGRYGLHTMYCQENHLLGNRFVGNVAGCAIMFSNHLEVRGNDFFRNRGPRTYGLLLRDCSDGRFENNRMVENTVAVFMDNSNRNRIRANLLQDNGWGILMFSSCAGNEAAGNSFINNDYPVALDMRRSSNRFDDGREGNYWSENTPYDLDGDGAGDVPYSPVGTFAFLSKQYPDLAVLAKSPAVAALGVAERVLPALRPSELVDHHPRLVPARTDGAGGELRRGGGRRTEGLAAAGFAALAIAGLAALRGTRPA